MSYWGQRKGKNYHFLSSYNMPGTAARPAVHDLRGGDVVILTRVSQTVSRERPGVFIALHQHQSVQQQDVHDGQRK